MSLSYHEKVIIRPRDKPWMTGHICKAVQKRDRLLKTYSKYKSPTSWHRYSVQRNLVVSLVRKAKINYNTKTNQALSDPAISSKKWWRIVKSMHGNKWPSLREIFLYLIQNKKLTFSMIISRVKLLYQRVTLLTLPRWSSDSLSVITADEEMVRNLMSSVNISKATGYDGISNKIKRLLYVVRVYINHSQV